MSDRKTNIITAVLAITGLLMVVVIIVLSCLLAEQLSEDEKSPTQPHIVFVMIDDMGHGDIGYNNPDVQTPTLDRLARSGRIFTQAYTLSQCTPSRSSLLTGRYAYRMGMQRAAMRAAAPYCLPTNIKILPQYLKDQGYKTHYVGKWHVGFCKKECLPRSRGFDTFYGTYNGALEHDTFRTPLSFLSFRGYDLRDGDHIDFHPAINHTTDVYTIRAVDVLRRHQEETPDSPMFLFLSYMAVHSPVLAPEDYEKVFSNVTDPFRRKTLGMLLHLDRNIETLMQTLKETGIDKNLLFIFTSDNGGDSENHCNIPFRGGKGSLWEGGSRVPLFAYGSALRNVPDVSNGFIHVVDWMSTLTSIAGNKQEAVDGIDLSSMIISGANSDRNEIVYNLDMEYLPMLGQAAIRHGNMKLIWGPAGMTDGYGYNMTEPLPLKFVVEYFGLPVKEPVSVEDRNKYMELVEGQTFSLEDINSGVWRLYDLQDDPQEKHNLSQDPKHQDLILRMKQRILDLIQEGYIPPPEGATAVLLEEAMAVMVNDSWETGWCDGFNITV